MSQNQPLLDNVANALRQNSELSAIGVERIL